MRKVFIADPALKSHHGHHHAITKRFSASLNCNNEVIWLANKGYQLDPSDKDGKFKVDLVFSEGTYDGYNKQGVQDSVLWRGEWIAPVKQKIISVLRKIHHLSPAFVHRKTSYLYNMLQDVITNFTSVPVKEKDEVVLPEQELFKSLSQHKCSVDDCVIFHTCDAHTYRDVLAFFTRVLSLGQWNKFPAFILSTPYDMQVMPHNKSDKSANHSIMHMRALGLLDTRIFLYAENELLADQLAAEWGVNVSALYIPYTGKSSKVDSTHDTNALNIVYLGAARTEKGFVDIAEVIAKFLVDSDRRDVCFTVQITPQIMGYTNDVKLAVEKLKSINDDRLQLIHNVLSPESYDEVLLSADVILLFYDRERYAVRSSGIVIEAIENGKNVIATEGTFPAYMAGNAGVIVKTSSEIINAIDEIADNRELYKRAADIRRKWVLEKCSIDRMHDVISRGKMVDFRESIFKVPIDDRLMDRHDLTWRKLI